jgi:hypothetical protein
MIAGTAGMAISKEVAPEVKTNVEKPAVEKCPCKQKFEEALGLSKEQVKLADANRKKEAEALKPVNAEIKAKNAKIKEIKESDLTKEEEKKNQTAALKNEIQKLKKQSEQIKANHNKNFESYLTKGQKNTLQQMREDKKAGKSCCPCGKNRYY